MLYRVVYRDESEELIDAATIKEAREQAQELYDEPIRKIVAASGADEDDDDTLEPESDDEDDSESENPDDDDAESDDE